LGIAALEDKIVQQAAVTVLNQIYEADFQGFSYGFRPGRGPHQALDALTVGIQRKRVNWVLDADIRGFFGAPGLSRAFSAGAIPAQARGTSRLTWNRALGSWRQQHGLSVGRATSRP
jgi:hypothetical protein